MSYPLTLILPYYDNAEMFREQQRQWTKIHSKLRASLRVIVVDDGSPNEPAEKHIDEDAIKALPSFRLFRTGVDVRWNWLFCRNLGVEKADTEWIVMTDMDHVIPGATWGTLMKLKLDKLNAYRLSRVDAPDLTPAPAHPNTWVMTRHMFLNRVGGYDERFSGIYGSDGEFHGRVAQWAKEVILLKCFSIRYHPEQIADASTTRYTRKEQSDHDTKVAIREELRKLGPEAVPKRLTFPWTEVYSHAA